MYDSFIIGYSSNTNVFTCMVNGNQLWQRTKGGLYLVPENDSKSFSQICDSWDSTFLVRPLHISLGVPFRRRELLCIF